MMKTFASFSVAACFRAAAFVRTCDYSIPYSTIPALNEIYFLAGGTTSISRPAMVVFGGGVFFSVTYL